MRVGENPNKNSNKEIISNSYHRIIVPVYIPNLKDDYFINSFNVLKVCIDSILISLHSKSKLSVISNGSCDEVIDFLNNRYLSHDKFDQLFLSKINLGKINAVMSVVKSCQEKLITVTDSDVLFKVGWQQAVESIFNIFPEAGMVSPVPHSKGYINFGYNNSYFGLFNGNVLFDDLRDPGALKKFEDSLQRNVLDPIHYEKYLILKNGCGKAVFGCGHFVATYRSDVFCKSPNKPSKDYLSTQSDKDYLDLANEKAGYLRLATLENYAFHLGNYFEDWMEDEFNHNLEISKSFDHEFTDISVGRPYNSLQVQVGKILNKFFYHKYRKYFFTYLGQKGF